MLQLLFSGLSSGCVYPTNLLPTGVVITSNNHHRRLLPTDSFGPPNRSIPVMRTEPSFLSNQLLRVGQGWGFFLTLGGCSANCKSLPNGTNDKRYFLLFFHLRCQIRSNRVLDNKLFDKLTVPCYH